MSVVVPIDENAKLQRDMIAFAEWLGEQLSQNRVAALCVRGVDVDGEPIAIDVVALNSEPIRYMQIGQLHEAIDMLVTSE